MISTARELDAIVIGAGHNGLVCAAYLAKSGLRVEVLEARPVVGGTAGHEPFGDATVNICNCDHLTFRTTPVHEELELARHGLAYIDVEPAQFQMHWDARRAWAIHHDVEATCASLAEVSPRAAQAYTRYAKEAIPAARLVLEAAASGPPTRRRLVATAARHGGRGAKTLLSWSKLSAAEVMRSHFGDDDHVLGPAMVVGPVVWGVSPETPGTGLAALAFALRHVGRVGRPVGGSGSLTEALRSVIQAHGGVVRTSTEVAAVICAAGRVRGVRTRSGDHFSAPVVISACDPRTTFVEWLESPPEESRRLIERWRSVRHVEGYESKLDIITSSPPRWIDGHPIGPTTVVSGGVSDIVEAHHLSSTGRIASRPAFLVNVPTALDPSMAPTGRHVISLEVLYTPLSVEGGWAGSAEPRRWVDLLAGLLEPGFSDSIEAWRAVTPDVYERDFHLPLGHAASFAGGPLAALRPTAPELVRYRTAVPGLYLTGAATFPGAGVWGASGRNTGLTVIADIGRSR
jgi:beta-carotene ketolase (CrtO type)